MKERGKGGETMREREKESEREREGEKGREKERTVFIPDANRSKHLCVWQPIPR